MDSTLEKSEKDIFECGMKNFPSQFVGREREGELVETRPLIVRALVNTRSGKMGDKFG